MSYFISVTFFLLFSFTITKTYSGNKTNPILKRCYLQCQIAIAFSNDVAISLTATSLKEYWLLKVLLILCKELVINVDYHLNNCTLRNRHTD